MRWSFKSLFYNGYQKALVDAEHYEKPFKAEDVKKELAGVRDYESRNLMESSLTDGTDGQGNVTISRIVTQIETLEWAMRWELDNHMREFGRDAKLGAEMLANHLVARANQIARDIKPGGKDKLGDALG